MSLTQARQYLDDSFIVFSFPDSARTFTYFVYVDTAAKGITLQSTPAVSLPNDLVVGVAYDLVRAFTMPFGTVNVQFVSGTTPVHCSTLRT